MFLYITVPFIISFVGNVVSALFSKKTGFFIDRVDSDKPQKVHKTPVPRIGGIGIFLGFFTGIFFFMENKDFMLGLFISSLPVFLTGLFEDYHGNIPPKLRLVFMSVGAALSVFTLNAVVNSIGFISFPFFIAVPFTIFAVVGIINAFNMVDGLNGLSSGLGIISLTFFSYVLYMVGDLEFFTLCVVLAGSLLGFFILNFPYGKIFLGDGGAYFLGFLMAVISVLMVSRNPEISPWFPVVILAYPIFDVLFAMFRRKFIQKTSPFSPDKLHLHSLIYKKIVRNNPLSSMFIFALSVPFDFMAVLFFDNTNVLFFLFVMFCLTYLLLYYYLSKNLIKRRVKLG